jgi:hypothetical protein
LIILATLLSCEQATVTPKLATAPGGGTLSAYKAYTLDSIVGQNNVYGRIVFWKDNANNTLVQISLYNTSKDTAYPTGIFKGIAAAGPVDELMPLYSIDGTTGEFGTSKFYVIGDKNFYSSIDKLDAHIRILVGAALVASGNVGSNSKPVATEEN